MSVNVSVIVTTFNGAKYIVKQLVSILNQTTRPEEIIICDDLSTDETILLITPFLSDHRIKLLVNDATIGIVNNFKKAAALAKPENWLAFADQDDIWLPQKLEVLTTAMAAIDDEQTPCLVFSDLSVIDKNDVVTASSFWGKQRIRPAKLRLSTLLYGNVVTGCTMMINRPMIREFLIFTEPGVFHDEWMGFIAYSLGKVKMLPETLVLYRQHENNITFSENYKTPGFIDGLAEIRDNLTGKKKFSQRQFSVAKTFLQAYRHKLNREQVLVIEKFIRQEHKNYFIQRLTRWLTYLR